MCRELISLLPPQIDYTVLLPPYAAMDVLSRRFHGALSNCLGVIGPEFWMSGIYLRYVFFIY
jgi:hypothetical protein